jgi:hypothetical protein
VYKINHSQVGQTPLIFLEKRPAKQQLGTMISFLFAKCIIYFIWQNAHHHREYVKPDFSITLSLALVRAQDKSASRTKSREKNRRKFNNRQVR